VSGVAIFVARAVSKLCPIQRHAAQKARQSRLKSRRSGVLWRIKYLHLYLKINDDHRRILSDSSG